MNAPARWATYRVRAMRFVWFCPILSAVALALGTTPAAAQWSPGGVRLCQAGSAGYVGRSISDGAGGAYVAWAEVPPETDADIYVQRVTASGTTAPGWPPRGLPVVVLPASQGLRDMAPDGQGGALIVWEDFRNSGTGGTSLD